MGLEAVLDEIVKEGKEKLEKIKKEAETEVEEIIKSAEEQAREILDKAKKEAEKEVLMLKKQVLSSVRLELKREELRRKQEIMNEVFERLKERIKNMNTDSKRKILKELINKYEENGCKVYSRKEDKDIVKEITKMQYGGEIDCIGGIIIEKGDESYRINLIFDEIVKELYEGKIKEVHKILFE